MSDVWKNVGILVILIILFLVAFFGLLGLRRNLTKSPEVNINLDEVTYTDKDKVTVTGTTDPKAKLRVNEQDVPVNSDGSFSFDQNLIVGDNKMKIVAENSGKSTTVEKNIVRQVADKDVAGSSNVNQNSLDANSSLNNSGPVENVVGVFGLTAIFLTYNYYRKSKRATAS